MVSVTSTSYTLVTGASSGIGAACARTLSAQGRNLILIARRRERLEELAKECEANGVSVLIHEVDVTNRTDVDSFFESVSELSIDVLINNAGLAAGKDEFSTSNWDDYDQMIDLNIKAFTYVARKCISFLKETSGHLVTISSIAGIEAYEGGSVYCGTKAYVKIVSEALRIDLMGTGVRVTDIAPGAVDTEFSDVRFKGDESLREKVYEGYEPLTADDIADTISFALSRPAHVDLSYIQIMPTAQASATRIHRQ